ncbi:MAG: DNA repair protein RecN [Bacteroidales bacterium]
MFRLLSIKNYALIRELEMQFPEALTVITGETGAGKSIMLGALSLILGKRADTGVLMDKKKKCVVEGTFRIRDYQLESFFSSHDLDFDEQTIMRREISPSGRSRAFINDTPVRLDLMKALGDKLVNIHSQQETVTLNDSAFQLGVLDGYAGLNAEAAKFRKDFRIYKQKDRELSELKALEQKSAADLEYYNFQLEELDKAMLREGEQEELEGELDILANAEEIKQVLLELNLVLEEEEQSVSASLSGLIRRLSGLSGYSKELGDIYKRLDSAAIELSDIATEAGRLSEKSSLDPGRLAAVNERLDTLYQLQHKHRVQSVRELIDLRDSFRKKINSIGSLEKQIEDLEKETDRLYADLDKRAMEIRKRRKAAFPGFEDHVLSVVRQLGMPDAVFRVRHKALQELSHDGKDKIIFLFNANRGGEPKELNKVVSGGEMSRLMLAVKSLVSEHNLLPTIVFDEIDAGVSGDIADKMGRILERMAAKMQVIAITHLPQIAGKGEAHYKVYKETDQSQTYSGIRALTPEERVEEIAQLLSGENVTASAVQTARELLDIFKG